MSEYYSSWEIERKFSDYEERLKKQQARIDYLEQRREEEEEHLSDDEKDKAGGRLRWELTMKYDCDFKEAIKYVDYSNKKEFNSFYFNMFNYYEINLIPKEAYEKATEEQIRNILYYLIPNFGDRIVWFGSKVKKLSKKQMNFLSNRQCVLIADMGLYSILSDDQRKTVLQNKIPNQQYNNNCLLI